MLKRFLLILLASAVLLSACGGGEPPQPTVSVVDIQNTAMAAASTFMAQTQAAQPTATPLPSTDVPSPTPLPTFTPDLSLMPTFGIPVIPATPTQAAGADTCLKPLNTAEAGPTKKVRIENTTTGTATLSLTLWTPNLYGQCGSLSYVVKQGQKVKIDIPNGSWFAYAWIDTGKKQTTAQGEFYLGPSKTDDLLRLVIREQVIGLIGP